MTAQSMDEIFYEGEIYYIASEPLAEYLSKLNPKIPLIATSTACHKGYTSKWAIDNNKLFLTEWCGYSYNEVQLDINSIFPDEDFVFAFWYSGTIRIPLGEEITTGYQGGYLAKHEGDMFLEFNFGILEKKTINWRTSKEIEEIRRKDMELPF